MNGLDLLSRLQETKHTPPHRRLYIRNRSREDYSYNLKKLFFILDKKFKLTTYSLNSDAIGELCKDVLRIHIKETAIVIRKSPGVGWNIEFYGPDNNGHTVRGCLLQYISQQMIDYLIGHGYYGRDEVLQ